MRRPALLTQVLLVNLLLIVAAVVTAAIAASPGTELQTPQAALVLGLAVSLSIVFNVLLIQRRFQPLEELVDQMERADLSRPGANLSAGADPRHPEEVARLHHAFARMLERLEAERRRASSAALAAQEEERTRVARDLHDEVNQSLTGLLLRLEAAREKAPPELALELAEIRRVANQAMEELLTLARQLRPTALDDLGLEAALAGNVREVANQGVVRASFDADGQFRGLAKDAQLVVYRVAQEALSNAVRHSERRPGPRQPASRRRPGRAQRRRRRPRFHLRSDQSGARDRRYARARAAGRRRVPDRVATGDRHKGSPARADRDN